MGAVSSAIRCRIALSLSGPFPFFPFFEGRGLGATVAGPADAGLEAAAGGPDAAGGPAPADEGLEAAASGFSCAADALGASAGLGAASTGPGCAAEGLSASAS